MGNPSLDFSLFQIKLFLTVAETRSFSRAAEAMHMEQSTLSRRIAVLEQELGFSLFNRDSRPIALTHWGSILCEQWKPLVGAFEHTLSMVQSQREKEKGLLSICMIDSSIQLHDIPAITKLMRDSYPEVTLMFHYSPLSHWQETIRDGLCDMAITTGFDLGGIGGQYYTCELMRTPKMACFLKSNPLSQKDHISYDDLRDQRFITIAESTTPHHADYIRSICHTHGFDPVFSGISSNAHGLTSMLQRDNEVLICDAYLRGLDNPMFMLHPLPDTWSGLFAVYPRENCNPYIDAFIKIFQQYYHGS